MLAQLCNYGRAPMFTRGISTSQIDLTFASRKTTVRLTDWLVMEEERLNYHRYIKYAIMSERIRNVYATSDTGEAAKWVGESSTRLSSRFYSKQLLSNQ